jgi:hypothetical protein
MRGRCIPPSHAGDFRRNECHIRRSPKDCSVDCSGGFVFGRDSATLTFFGKLSPAHQDEIGSRHLGQGPHTLSSA